MLGLWKVDFLFIALSKDELEHPLSLGDARNKGTKYAEVSQEDLFMAMSL